MKIYLIAACALLHAGTAHCQEWLPESYISFYETEVDRQILASTLQAQRLGQAGAEWDEPFNGAPSRPHGFGRELDDQSPADWDGLKRDTAYFFGYQFFIVGALYVLPESVSAWTEEQKEEYTFEKWKDNVTHPRWDPDEWYINYILHPYWGMTYYTRGRERGLTETGAFWYSFTLSSIYEFGLEALFEPVSIQDVIFTPVLGSALGWYLEDVRREIKSQNAFSGWDKTILIATDPLGTLNAMADNLFGVGVESELEFRSFYRSPAITTTESWQQNDPYESRLNPVVADYLGLELTLSWH
ncbi:MAG: DUF3943 domain-containing protein [Candidatus Thiodiazotropha sp. (ex Gloverina cf. vestifex)]|nr:DUF3943 domain-containing protein [Candidatus Thiodiazotropha sp. (ex Gloverina cf. vestifex)]